MDLASSLAKLNYKERIYVEQRLAGLGKVAAARAAGYANANSSASRIENSEDVQRALVAGMNQVAEEIGFTRKEAHDMLMSAYLNAVTAAEQVMAVRAMIELHGIAAPKQVEHKHQHSHTHQLEYMETEDLMKLAELDGLTLDGEYEVIEELEPALIEHQDG